MAAEAASLIPRRARLALAIGMAVFGEMSDLIRSIVRTTLYGKTPGRENRGVRHRLMVGPLPDLKGVGPAI